MANKTINLSEAQNIGVTADQIVVNNINLKSDDSGLWTIGLALVLTAPDRTPVEGITFNENHRMGFRVNVTRAEIATAAGIDEADVRSTLTLEQTETHVTTIAVGRILAATGLNA